MENAYKILLNRFKIQLMYLIFAMKEFVVNKDDSGEMNESESSRRQEQKMLGNFSRHCHRIHSQTS